MEVGEAKAATETAEKELEQAKAQQLEQATVAKNLEKDLATKHAKVSALLGASLFATGAERDSLSAPLPAGTSLSDALTIAEVTDVQSAIGTHTTVVQLLATAKPTHLRSRG